MHRRSMTLAIAASVALLSGAAQAVTIFTDRSAFEAAAGALAVETFDAPIATADSITFAGGIKATKTSSGFPPTLNRVARGIYTGFLARDSFRDIILDFGRNVTAFGADVSGLNVLSGDRSALLVSGAFDGTVQTLSVSDAVGSGGFFGIVSSTGFDSVTLGTDSGAFLFGGTVPFGGETFNLDNVAVSAVPLPATLPLLLAAFGSVALLRRRRL